VGVGRALIFSFNKLWMEMRKKGEEVGRPLGGGWWWWWWCMFMEHTMLNDEVRWTVGSCIGRRSSWCTMGSLVKRNLVMEILGGIFAYWRKTHFLFLFLLFLTGSGLIFASLSSFPFDEVSWAVILADK
jgi:hypothetical protein